MRPVPEEPAASQEAGLVRQAAAGRREAFGELVLRYEESLFRFLLVRCGSREDAEELCQESFLRAWQRLERYDPRWRFSTWLFTLARHLAISSRRAAAAPVAEARVDALGVDHAPERDLALRERREGLWSLAGRVLSEDQRTALWLRYAEGQSAEEIGRVIDRRAPAVRVLLHRARALLAEHVDPTLADEDPREAADALPFLPVVRPGRALEGGS